ncbi:vomeronasal type-1 receptor 4-like [Diceros bicornis minor]|uniref:vomeronasal type-1 receptor 4-like n=1 Tax=Diceros bicornis minor TaxID=77932 RepID=UPI0026EB00A8|nr:vomeronasal type-1 receptor 4-like [Diceros bicornis minor]
MATRDLAIGIILSLQTIVGILGNLSVLCFHLFLYLTRCKFRSTDLIIKNLTIANLLVIFSRGVPQMMACFGLKDFLNDFACRHVFYVHRVSRDVSIGTTCLLSVFQAIMISPLNSRWAELKVKAPKYIGTSSIFCWILNMMLNIILPLHMTHKKNNTNFIQKRDYDYCYDILHGNITPKLYVALILCRNGFCLILMVWASGFMVFILHRHKQQVQYIHRKNLSPRSSPESTAMQSILVLVCTFVSLWTLSSIFHICLAVFNNPSLWLRNTSTLIAACFPTVSPYILLSHDARVSWVCFAWNGIQNLLNFS